MEIFLGRTWSNHECHRAESNEEVLRREFQAMDTSGDGSLDAEKLHEGLQRLQMRMEKGPLDGTSSRRSLKLLLAVNIWPKRCGDASVRKGYWWLIFELFGRYLAVFTERSFSSPCDISV